MCFRNTSRCSSSRQRRRCYRHHLRRRACREPRLSTTIAAGGEIFAALLVPVVSKICCCSGHVYADGNVRRECGFETPANSAISSDGSCAVSRAGVHCAQKLLSRRLVQEPIFHSACASCSRQQGLPGLAVRAPLTTLSLFTDDCPSPITLTNIHF